jgi:hypothetical protein
MTVRLRPHHLFCLSTFAGEGYSTAFVAGVEAVVTRIAAGEPVELVEGPDDICAPLSGNPGAHCHGARVRDRDRQALSDARLRLRRPLHIGAPLSARDQTPWFRTLRRLAFRTGGLAPACRGCRWTDLCSDVRAARSRGPRLL